MEPNEAGRTASREDLDRRLANAALTYLLGALDNPLLEPRHLLVCLKSPAADGALIARVCRNREWLKAYDVKVAIVLHPRTPRPVAMNLVRHLWWRDLARVSDGTSLAPALRRAAERILATRLREMAIGERIALARMAGRGIIGALRLDLDPGVIRALLLNPRVVEEDVLGIAVLEETPPEVLGAVAAAPRWICRPPIRKALARNPSTPRVAALRVVQGLSSAALRELLHSSRVPTLVRVAALRLLEARRESRGDAVPQH